LSTPRVKEVLPMFDWVRVSLNSSSKEYPSVHGVDGYSKVVDGIVSLDKSGCFYGLSYIRSNESYSDFEVLLNEIKSLGLLNLSYFRIARDVSKRDEILQEVDKPKFNAIVHPVFVDWAEARKMSVPEKCVMHKIKPCIDSNGDVYPCCISQYTKTNVIGRLSDYAGVMTGKAEYSPDVAKCSYCIYKEINNAAAFFEAAEVKNPNFI